MGTGAVWGTRKLFDSPLDSQREASCCTRVGDLWTAGSVQEETHGCMQTHSVHVQVHTGGHLMNVHTNPQRAHIQTHRRPSNECAHKPTVSTHTDTRTAI